jgi:hypothetical protein
MVVYQVINLLLHKSTAQLNNKKRTEGPKKWIDSEKKDLEGLRYCVVQPVEEALPVRAGLAKRKRRAHTIEDAEDAAKATSVTF